MHPWQRLNLKGGANIFSKIVIQSLRPATISKNANQSLDSPCIGDLIANGMDTNLWWNLAEVVAGLWLRRAPAWGISHHFGGTRTAQRDTLSVTRILAGWRPTLWKLTNVWKTKSTAFWARGLGQSSHVEYRNMSRLRGPRSVDNSRLFFEAEFLYCKLSMQDVSACLFTSNSQTFVEFGNSSTYQTYHCIFAVFAAVCSVWSLDLAGGWFPLS